MRRANDPQRREKIIQATLEAVKLYGIHAVTGDAANLLI